MTKAAFLFTRHQQKQKMIQKHLKNPRLWQISGLIIADLVFFSTTNPSNVPSYMLVVGFVLFMATFYYLVLGLFRLGKWYGLDFTNKQIRLARIITVVTGVILALQTTGQLSHREIFVLIPLAMIAYAYMSYVRLNRQSVSVTD